MKITKLKQARKLKNIALQDMAYILDQDISNLSKYERGLKDPTLRVQLGYFIITNMSLSQTFKNDINELINKLSLKVTNLICFLEEEIQTNKIKQRIATLSAALDNISCLKDISKKEDE